MSEDAKIVAMRLIMLRMAARARNIIETGEGLAPNAPSTIARKGRDAPLRDTEELKNNIVGLVTVEKGQVKGTLTAEGEENQKKLWINEVGWPGHIPARPVISRVFDEFGPAIVDEGLEVVMDDLEHRWLQDRR